MADTSCTKKRINSNKKGKTFERAIAKILREHYGYDTHRGIQTRGGGKEAADVAGLPRIHIECKREETLSVEKWLQQSERDAGIGEYPIVIYKQNNKPIQVSMRTRDFIELVTGGTIHSSGKITMQFEDFMTVYEETK